MEQPTEVETSTESVIKHSLATDRKDSYKSKEILIQKIIDAIESLDASELRENFEFLAISDRKAIITLKSVDKERSKLLINEVTTLLKGCTHFGQDISLTNV